LIIDTTNGMLWDVKISLLTGRGREPQTEWNMFLDHPFVGVGVGGEPKEERIEATGDVVASHE
jgi:hypothetical protein